MDKITANPIKAIGITREAKRIGSFVYKELKSFESKLMILPNYWNLPVYCEILDSLV